MGRWMLLVGVFLSGTTVYAGTPSPTVTGLNHPYAVVSGSDGHFYVSEMGEAGKEGSGRVLTLTNLTGKPAPLATGLDNPKGMVLWHSRLFVADGQRVWRIDEKGKAQVFAAKEAFPTEPGSLHGIAADENGILYVTDSGSAKQPGGAIHRIDHQGKVKRVADARSTPALQTPTGVVLDGISHLLVLDSATGDLLRVKIADGSAAKVADGFTGGDGLAWDWFGQLFITSSTQGKLWGIARPGQQAVALTYGLQCPGNVCFDPADPAGAIMLVPDTKAGTLSRLPTGIPGNEVDTRPLPLAGVPAFPELKWTGWEPYNDQGKPVELRPVFLTHAGDGSNRNFVTIQQGTIHVFPNDPKAQQTKVFLDIHEKVFYHDAQNEQGLLGLTFHPNFKNNGEFFVFYSLRQPRLTNVLSRFRVSKDDPDKADPASEEELLRIKRPFWNHDGGTICFGPDGYLYVVLGDGGLANDPQKNGQKLSTLLAKILRIDVDHPAGGKKYGIPGDNPFVGKADAAPEIWAYGLRNPWRIAFDRKTGWLWAADVGQNIYEELDIIVKGGNYGWSLREGLHPFTPNGVGPRPDLIEPIWEYHHDVGKSVTGGLVYRGSRLPELEGHYLYGDYLSGRMWALQYDGAKKRVVANRPLQRTKELIFSFAEDERGEVYFLAPSQTGQSIFSFERTAKGN